MYEMKEGGRSGEQSGAVVKKKSSSGCLIIKKKGGDNGVGMGGFSGVASSRQFFDSGKEKKRSRRNLSDSESSEEFVEPVRRKIVSGSDKFRNGSAIYEKSLKGSREIERDRMRNGLDVFEFDEYERFDEKIRNDFYEDRLKLHRHSGDLRESGSGSSRIMMDKRKHSYHDSTSNVYTAKSKSKHGSKMRFESEDDEAHLPISLLRERYREASDESIRVQGKNGVLKVMVNKKKNMDLPHKGYDHADVKGRKDSRSEDVFKMKLGMSQKSYDHLKAEDRKGSRSQDPIKTKAVMRPSFHSEKRPEKPIASVKMDKSEVKQHKSLSTKSNKETGDSDTALKLGSPNMQACSSTKSVKNEETPPSEKITQVKGKESKVKRGSGTEKQLLREKIRNMLLASGWTIDYRPRRNRDYLDAVYINPSGTAYWSIIKAYEAFQKEEKAAVKPVGEFTPLPDEILSKLTRQTRKKREREEKKKRRDEGNSRSAKKVKVKDSAHSVDSDQQDDKLSSYMKPNRKSLKDGLNEEDNESGDDSSDNLEETPGQKVLHGRKSKKIGRTLVVRSSDKGQNSDNDGFVPYTGKRTLLSWLIDSGTVEMSEKVQYMNRKKTRVMLEGWVTRDGIHCCCCSKILTVSKFELHAGSKLRLPFSNIFLQSGQSLMECQIDAWNKQEESDRKGFHTIDIDGNDPNDDTCGLCGDGGDLICCDGCPSTFHQSCLNIQMLPKGDWHCPNCACKYCGIAGGTGTEASSGAETALLMCRLCEKKCHESCREGMNDVPADCGDATISFCGHKCQELYRHLLKLLGVKHELESGFSWSLLCRCDSSSDYLPLEFSQKVECNSKLAIALSVMDECFLPIVDRRSGINLIHNVVYNCGSNFSRLNYSRFYTAILERGDEIIAAASIRIHGTQLAEMPFIGTRHIYRRQGMCRRLLSAIESALSSFKVEKLIIPAIAEHMHTWTDVFGFTPIEESHKQEMRSMNMLVFPGTDMLQKPIKRHKIPMGNIAPPSGANCLEVETNDPLKIKSESSSPNVKEINGKVVSTDSSPQATPAPPSDDSSLDNTREPVLQPSDINPSISKTGEPALDSPVKVDIQVPVLENKSKKSSSLVLDLNTFDDTKEEQEGNGAGDKVDPEFCHKESVSLNELTDKKIAESSTDLQGESPSDVSAVALEAAEPPPDEERVRLDDKGSESKPDLQFISVSDASAITLGTPELTHVKENVQLDSKGSELKPDLQFISVSDASAITLETPELPPVKENVHLDSKSSETKPDLQCISTSDDASAVAFETLEPPRIKENVQLDSKGSESNPELSASDSTAVVLETSEPPPVKENVHLDSKGSETKADLQCISASDDASAVAFETLEPPPIKENVQLDSKGSESNPELSASDSTAVVLETSEPLPVKENDQFDSKGSESEPDFQSVSDASAVTPETLEPYPVKENVQFDSKCSESKPDLQNAAALETPEPHVKEKVQLDGKGSESNPDLQRSSVRDASAGALGTLESPPVTENVQFDSKGSESKPDLQSISVSEMNTTALETPEPPVNEKVQLDGRGSESNPGCQSVSDESAVTPETLEPPVKENVQFNRKGSESKSDVQYISVSETNTAALETPEPPVKLKVQLDGKGSESNPDFPSVSDESAVAPETLEPPPMKENVQFDCKGSESKCDVQCISVSETNATALETSEPPVKEKVQLDAKGSESKPDFQSVSDATLEPHEPPVTEKIQLDAKNSESKPDLQPRSVSDTSPVALETPDPPKENIQPPIDCTGNADEANSKIALKLENEFSEEQNPTEEENKNPNPEPLMANFSSDLNLPGKEETRKQC